MEKPANQNEEFMAEAWTYKRVLAGFGIVVTDLFKLQNLIDESTANFFADKE